MLVLLVPYLTLQFPSSYISRDEEVSELVLSMADVSTNLVMLTGTLNRSLVPHRP
jgi:hypothetical protein